MVTESVDPKTGTILFHEDQESKNIRLLLCRVNKLEKEIERLKLIIEERS